VSGATSSIHRPGESRVVSLLPAAERQRLLQRCERMDMKSKQLLFEANGPISHVYFPLSGMASMVLKAESGTAVEVGTVGNEGMVGMPVYLGAKSSPTEGVWQVSGETLRMPAEDLSAALEREGELRFVLQRFSQALMNQISQSVLCNHHHPIEKRLARWLLMTHDRVGADQFDLIEEHMGQMLAVRPPAAVATAGALEEAGLIRYDRGHLTIVDRPGLEASACECYEVVRREFERLLGA
jgi:CRP-like cAMP-binding protein